jgi:septin family protein
MVVGESGLGKSTFLRTLFKVHLPLLARSYHGCRSPCPPRVLIHCLRNARPQGFVDQQQLIPGEGRPERSGSGADAPLAGAPTPDSRVNFNMPVNQGKTVRVREIGNLTKLVGGTKFIFTVVDTPGYGDYIDNNRSFEPIEGYIDLQYQLFREKEVSLEVDEIRRVELDGRIHCCFYFIAVRTHSPTHSPTTRIGSTCYLPTHPAAPPRQAAGPGVHEAAAAARGYRAHPGQGAVVCSC